MTAPVSDAFAEVISLWDQTLRCQSRVTARGCSRPAYWLAHIHDHGDRPVCTWHLNRWRRDAQRSIDRCGTVGCVDCDREFTSLDAHAMIRPL